LLFDAQDEEKDEEKSNEEIDNFDNRHALER
jgi:hypothetical protein